MLLPLAGGTVNTGLVVGLTLLLLFLLIAAGVMVTLVRKGVIKLDCKQSNAHTGKYHIFTLIAAATKLMLHSFY